MRVKGILVEGEDGKQYLLGMEQRDTVKKRPTIWRYASGESVSLEGTNKASRTIREQLHSPRLKNHDEYVRWAVLEATGEFLKDFFGEVRWG